MPRRPALPQLASMEDRVAASWLEDAEKVAARIAAEEGDAPGTQKKGDAELVKLWGTQDRRVDPDLLRQRMSTTGLGEEAMTMTIAEEWPEIVDLYAQPVEDPLLLEQLLILAEYPFRRSVYEDIDDPEEQVKEAERIHGLWLKSQPVLPESNVTSAEGMGDDAALPPPVSPGPSYPESAPQPMMMEPQPAPETAPMMPALGG
jgi:hypothetical protein